MRELPTSLPGAGARLAGQDMPTPPEEDPREHPELIGTAALRERAVCQFNQTPGSHPAGGVIPGSPQISPLT